MHLTLAMLFISTSIYQYLLWANNIGKKLPKSILVDKEIVLKIKNLLNLMVLSLFSLLFIGAWLATSEWGVLPPLVLLGGWKAGLCVRKIYSRLSNRWYNNSNDS